MQAFMKMDGMRMNVSVNKKAGGSKANHVGTALSFESTIQAKV